MDVSLYILLPEGDDVLSLVITKEKLDEMMRPLMTVKTFARERGINLRIFYDSENFTNFKTDVGEIVDDGSYMEKPTNILRSFVSSYSTDVNGGIQIESSCNYIRWDTVNCMSDSNVPVLLKSAYEAPSLPCVLSLGVESLENYYQVSIIKDRKYKENMPMIKKIPLFSSVKECMDWLLSLSGVKFSLYGNKAFERTNLQWDKQRIYKKKDDGSYWYFDYYHKDNKIHYEVFDTEGANLGEASPEGQIMRGTANPSKSISKILHGN